MNRSRGAEKKALPFAERAPAEQAPEPGERRLGYKAPLADDAAVGVLERYFRSGH